MQLNENMNLYEYQSIYVRSPAGGKISWYFRRSYGLTAGDADPLFFFLNFDTLSSFWDVADHYNYMRFYWMDDWWIDYW